jgi:predicted nucleic acid-binding protein
VKTKNVRSFWDSSALVPLFCHDSYSARSRELFRKFPEITVWWNTPVEIHGALTRLLKESSISQEGMARALGFLNEFRLRWREVLPVEAVRNLTEECLDRYGIRSADALQLAAAMTSCNGNPKGRPFVCFDAELCNAARQAGFDVRS